MTWVTFTLLIPANMLDTANKLAAAFDFDTGGGSTFRQGASANGMEPWSHYITNVPIRSEYVPLLMSAVGFRDKAAELATKRNRELAVTRQSTESLASVMTIIRGGGDYNSVLEPLGLHTEPVQVRTGESREAR